MRLGVGARNTRPLHSGHATASGAQRLPQCTHVTALGSSSRVVIGSPRCRISTCGARSTDRRRVLPTRRLSAGHPAIASVEIVGCVSRIDAPFARFNNQCVDASWRTPRTPGTRRLTVALNTDPQPLNTPARYEPVSTAIADAIAYVALFGGRWRAGAKAAEATIAPDTPARGRAPAGSDRSRRRRLRRRSALRAGRRRGRVRR